MTWSFRLIQTPNGVAVYHVYSSKQAGVFESCGTNPYVAEASNVDDLRFQLESILNDAMQQPILDGRQFGLFDAQDYPS